MRIGFRKSAALRTGQVGFTLVELVSVMIILSVLSAIAVPKYFELGSAARIASLKTMAAALNTATNNVRVLCKTQSTCDYANSAQVLYFNGQPANLNYGWLDAGDTLNNGEVDAWVTYSGFTPSLPNNSETLFTLDGSPTPANCSVRYRDVYFATPTSLPIITVTSSGC